MSLLEITGRLLSVTRAVLALVGLATVVAVAWASSREVLLQQVAGPAAAAEPAAEAMGALEIDPGPLQAVTVRQTEQPLDERAVAGFIARRYRVAEEAAQLFVRNAYRAGREVAVDPLLILAVMAVESRYNPVAESSMGAMGLMQVIPRYHAEKLPEGAGEQVLLDPEVNIRVGAQVLREYLRRFGETEAALQQYAGALDEPTAQYAAKVLAEKARLERALARVRREA